MDNWNSCPSLPPPPLNPPYHMAPYSWSDSSKWSIPLWSENNQSCVENLAHVKSFFIQGMSLKTNLGGVLLEQGLQMDD